MTMNMASATSEEQPKSEESTTTAPLFAVKLRKSTPNPSMQPVSNTPVSPSPALKLKKTERKADPVSDDASSKPLFAVNLKKNALQNGLVVLISNQSLSRDLLAKQDKLAMVLKLKDIPFTTIDGSTPANKHKCNELFVASGIRGEYPQFFLVDKEIPTFWGSWDRFEQANDDGVLDKELATTQT
jgi:hypothetical protein